jgi:hypothetical protein
VRGRARPARLPDRVECTESTSLKRVEPSTPFASDFLAGRAGGPGTTPDASRRIVRFQRRANA